MYLAGVPDPSALSLHVFENIFLSTWVLKSSICLFCDINFGAVFPEP